MANTSLYTLCVLCVVLCISHGAAAGPCIECKDCQGMASCFQVCKQTCPTAPAYETAACKDYGFKAASSAAQKACTMAMDYCGGASPQTATSAITAPSAPASPAMLQCASSALSTCQSRAMDPAASPCGKSFNGYKQCNGKQFVTFYAGIVNDACRVSSDLITNGVVIPAPVATPSVGGRKMLQASSIIIKNPTTISSSGAVASSIQKVPVPAGAQVIVPGQPALVPGPQVVVPGGPQVVVPGTPVPQQVIIQGQVQPVLLPGQPTGVIYPGQAVVVPGQPQVIYPAGH